MDYSFQHSIFLVSLNSQKLERTLDAYTDFILPSSTVTFFVFDTVEALNAIFFRASTVLTERERLDVLIDRVNEQLVPLHAQQPVQRFSDIEKVMSPYMAAVYEAYYTNSSFKKHCKNQSFRNLQPKLRVVGVEKHSDPMMELLSPFLLAEIAFYLYLYDTGSHDCVTGLEPEMEILQAIRAGKYPTLLPFVKYPLPYVQAIPTAAYAVAE